MWHAGTAPAQVRVRRADESHRRCDRGRARPSASLVTGRKPGTTRGTTSQLPGGVKTAIQPWSAPSPAGLAATGAACAVGVPGTVVEVLVVVGGSVVVVLVVGGSVVGTVVAGTTVVGTTAPMTVGTVVGGTVVLVVVVVVDGTSVVGAVGCTVVVGTVVVVVLVDAAARRSGGRGRGRRDLDRGAGAGRLQGTDVVHQPGERLVLGCGVRRQRRLGLSDRLRRGVPTGQRRRHGSGRGLEFREEVVLTNEARVVTLGSKRQLEALAAEHPNAVKGKQTAETVSRQLYDALLRPIGGIGQGRTLVIVRDGRLHLLPFDALLDDAGRYVAQTDTVVYAPSASSLYSRHRRTIARTPATSSGCRGGSIRVRRNETGQRDSRVQRQGTCRLAGVAG